MNYMTFDDTVRDICSLAYEDEKATKYTRVARAVNVVLNELNIHLFPNVRSTAIPIAENLTAPLPSDCAIVLKVGVCHNGRIRILGRDDKLCLPSNETLSGTASCCECSEDEEDPTTRDSSNSCPHCTFHNFSASEFFISELFGTDGYLLKELYGYTPRSFQNGTYRVDHANNRLILGSGYDIEVGLSLILEYKSSLTGSDYRMIPREAFQAIYFRTMDMLNFEQDQSKSSAQFLRYQQEYTRLKQMYHTYSLQNIIAAFRNGYKATPKR